jgi:hypothetical protein
MRNVRALSVVRGYNQQAVEFLRELLARAEGGEIVEILCAVKLARGEYEQCWTGCDNLHELVGQLERMKFLTLRRMDQ